jgi:SHS2 domain-containing protein
MYRFFDHTGDIGADLEAPTAELLFADAARALAESISDTSRVEPRIERRIEIEEDGLPMLLYGLLAELLVLFDAERLLLPDVRVEALTERTLRATARGERFDPARHEGRTEIKAVTLHELSVEKADGGWRGRVVFDV